MPGTLCAQCHHPPACGGPGPGKLGCPFRGGPSELPWLLGRICGSSWLPGGGGAGACCPHSHSPPPRKFPRGGGGQCLAFSGLWDQVSFRNTTFVLLPVYNPLALARSLLSPAEGKDPGPLLSASACSRAARMMGTAERSGLPCPGTLEEQQSFSMPTSGNRASARARPRADHRASTTLSWAHLLTHLTDKKPDTQRLRTMNTQASQGQGSGLLL